MTQNGARKFRVLVPELDYGELLKRVGHLVYPRDRGAEFVAVALRDAGFEVIHTDLHQTPEEIANAALQYDADAVVIVFYFCEMGYLREIQDHLKGKGRTDVLLCGGGNVRDWERQEINKVGIDRVFGPGTHTRDVVAYLREEIPRRRPA
jgi:methylmalonyl-CoA mutase C-terminal domain/subunit